MRIEVAFTPALLREPEGKLCVVVDLLRLTSTVITMFGRGLARALVVDTPGQARRAARAQPSLLLCGEEGGLPPSGFDYGNSPSEFDRLDLRGRRAVLATTNGTPALTHAARCPVVLVGAQLNARAVANGALREASANDLDITILCAGNNRGLRFALEDAFAAGGLVQEMIRRRRKLELRDSAVAALQIYRSYRGSVRAAFRDAAHGRALIALGLRRDLAFCGQRDRFAVVPRLRRSRDRSLWLRRR